MPVASVFNDAPIHENQNVLLTTTTLRQVAALPSRRARASRVSQAPSASSFAPLKTIKYCCLEGSRQLIIISLARMGQSQSMALGPYDACFLVEHGIMYMVLLIALSLKISEQDLLVPRCAWPFPSRSVGCLDLWTRLSLPVLKTKFRRTQREKRFILEQYRYPSIYA